MFRFVKAYKTILLTVSILVLLSISCRNTDEKQTVILLENNNLNAPVSLMMIDTGSVPRIDSLNAGQKKNQFVVSLKNPMLLSIKSDEKKTEFIAFPGDTVVVDLTKNITIYNNPKSKSYTENKSYTRFISEMEKASVKADSLAYAFLKGQSSDSFALIRNQVNTAFEELVDNSKEKAIEYIEENPGSIGIFRAINYFIRKTPLFNYSIDHKWFHKTDSLLLKHYPDHPYTISYHNRIKALAHSSGYDEYQGRGLKPGDTLPEISLKGLSNKLIEINPKKTALIYLWDHTSRSRRSNMQVKQLSEEFNESMLTIYAIGFDENYKRWASVITLDKMWWNNLIDPAGYNSILLSKLNNPPLPYLIIIDKNKRVLSTHASAAEAKVWLKNYFKKK